MRYLSGAKNRAKATEVMNIRILSYYDEHPVEDGRSGYRDGRRLSPVEPHSGGESDIQVGFTLAKSALGQGIRD
jgi:hypothetical protein